MDKISALQTGRFYKVKNPRKKFLCALCSAPREMKYSKNLNAKHYLQIIVLFAFTSWALFPIMGVKSLSSFFVIWMVLELANKMLYRKDIPCPYCGFDATWYRRDVNVANQKVKEFWNENHPELTNKSEVPVEAQTIPKPQSVQHNAQGHAEVI